MSNTAVTPELTVDQTDQADQTSQLDQADQAGKCVSCPHPTADHDPISTRFCGATVAGGFTRGCVCTPSMN